MKPKSNDMNVSEQLWNCYNFLLLSPDLSRIRKLLVRQNLFVQSLSIPGDIVECGVFKGAGLLYWAKLVEIHAPNSQKRVVGFDIFGAFRSVPLEEPEQDIAARHDQLTEESGVTLDQIMSNVEAAGLTHRIELIQGEIEQTAAAYVASHYGSRISLLHLDLDTYSGTKAALKAFWPVLSRGGLVVFDEYGVPGMGESQAVDEFFASTDLRPFAVPFAETPTAFLVKP